MSQDVDELASATVRMRKDGTLIQRIDGQEIVVATYSRQTGHLEFETKEYSVKLYNQCVSKISTVNKGTQPSNLTIHSFGVKGEARTDPKKLPKKPKIGPLGDAAEDYVQWYLDNDMAGAIIRYGIYTDDDGKPIKKAVRRVVETIIDQRDIEDEDLEPQKDGKKTFSKGPVGRGHELVEHKSAIIARRATALTFTPQEVVGGWQPEDPEFESTPAMQEAE
jgi:hypothetical protein